MNAAPRVVASSSSRGRIASRTEATSSKATATSSRSPSQRLATPSTACRAGRPGGRQSASRVEWSWSTPSTRSRAIRSLSRFGSTPARRLRAVRIDDGDQHRGRHLPLRCRSAPLPHVGDTNRRPARAAGTRPPGAGARRARSSCRIGTGRRHGVRLPEARPIGTTTLDNAFTDLERGPDGRARVPSTTPCRAHRHPLGRRALRLPHALHRRPAAGREPARPRRRADACPPNAFRTGDSVIRLVPGDSVTGVWAIAAQ